MKKSSCLCISNLDFSYKSSRVLNNISFTAVKGQLCGLLGPNGSGKTTLLKSINGVLANGNGKIQVNGMNLKDLDRKKIAGIMAVVPQENTTVFSFTVLQMVIMGGSARYGLFGRPGKKDYETAFEVLEEMGIDHLASRVFNELSGGEKQMVMIARALFQKPKILLLDEPTSHLDFKKQYRVMQVIQKITVEKDLATLITLHDPNLAGRYCHKLIMMKKGSIVYKGLKHKVFNADSLNATYDINVKIECSCDGSRYVVPEDKPECL